MPATDSNPSPPPSPPTAPENPMLGGGFLETNHFGWAGIPYGAREKIPAGSGVLVRPEMETSHSSGLY